MRHGPLPDVTLVGRALEGSDHAIFVSREDGRFLIANENAARLLGYTPQRLLELTVRDIATLSEPALATKYQELKETGAIRSTARLRRADGTLIEIGYWGTYTRIENVDYLLSITDPIDTARSVRANTRPKADHSVQRLEEVVKELQDVHGLPLETIFAHVMRVVASRRAVEPA